jgi:hypothetical protein
MSKLKPNASKSSSYWGNRYYPYHWWRRRYYPYHWWDRRWYSQPNSQPNIEAQPVQAKDMNEPSNIAAALQQAFCMRVDTMFMVKALQHSRDTQPTDEKIYELVDDMLEMYYMNWEILDETDLEELLAQDTESSETTTREPEPTLPPPPPPEPSPAPGTQPS